MFFWRSEVPAQRVVGDCPPLKELPEEGARRRRFFKKFNLVSEEKMSGERKSKT